MVDRSNDLNIILICEDTSQRTAQWPADKDNQITFCTNNSGLLVHMHPDSEPTLTDHQTKIGIYSRDPDLFLSTCEMGHCSRECNYQGE